MPVRNSTSGTIYPITLLQADQLISRLIGLLGTKKPAPDQGLHIIPCNSVHTIGMQYPLDILFLDRKGEILKTVSQLKPNRVSSGSSMSKSVLELPPGFIEKHKIKTGDQLHLTPDIRNHTSQIALRNLFHWPINICLGLLWSRFIIQSVQSWFLNGGPLNLGILIHNTFLLILFISRRKSTETSARLVDWLIPFLTMTCVMMLKPNPSHLPLASLISIVIQCVGMAFMIFSLASLGRSFGIVPANRRVKSSGAYQWMRHPLYAGEMVFYFGFLAGHFTPYNLLMILLILSGQIWRAFAEEKLLLRDNQYQSYFNQVRFRFIPGLF